MKARIPRKALLCLVTEVSQHTPLWQLLSVFPCLSRTSYMGASRVEANGLGGCWLSRMEGCAAYAGPGSD